MRKIILVTLILLLDFNTKVYSQDAYLGDIKLTAVRFDQRDWMPCDGRLLSISTYTNLYSLIGTIYGGNGTTNFALPDLRGRVPVGLGSGPGLSVRIQGEQSGSETNTLTEAQMPSHNHAVNAVVEDGNQSDPSGSFLAGSKVLDKGYSDVSAASTTMNDAMIGTTGQSQAINNMQPYTVVRYVICVNGLYPSIN